MCLGDAPYTLTQYFEFEEQIYDRMLRYYMASGDLTKVYPAWQVKVFECIRTKKLKNLGSLKRKISRSSLRETLPKPLTRPEMKAVIYTDDTELFKLLRYYTL